MRAFQSTLLKFLTALVLTLSFSAASALPSPPLYGYPSETRVYLWVQQVGFNNQPGSIPGGIKRMWVGIKFFANNTYPSRQTFYQPIITTPLSNWDGANGFVLTGNSYFNLSPDSSETIVDNRTRTGNYLVPAGFDSSAPDCNSVPDPDSSNTLNSGCNIYILNKYPGVLASTTAQVTITFLGYNGRYYKETIYQNWNANSAKDGYNFRKIMFNPGRVYSFIQGTDGYYYASGTTMLYSVPGATLNPH